MYLDRPIILLGRGGSGTRVLSEAAQHAGVFLGNDINISGDSVEWVRPIYDLTIDVCGGKTASPDARDRLRNHARDILEGGAWTPSQPWGWKLPETMLILPQVLEAFPAARVVHLVRHPVTMSLRRTHMTSRLDNPVGRSVLKASYRDIGRPVEMIETDEYWQHNAVSWLYQVRRVMRQGRDLMSPGDYMEQGFEDFCTAPEDGLARIVEFLCRDRGQPLKSDESPKIADYIDPVRAGGEARDAMTDSDAREPWIWSLCGPAAEELGYDRVPPTGAGGHA